MQFKVHNSTYNQELVGKNKYHFKYQTGRKNTEFDIYFILTDPCIADFLPKVILNEIAFMEDPQYVKYITKSVFNSPTLYPYCHVWTTIAITKVGGGNVNTSLFQSTTLIGASIPVAEANTMTINFN